MVRLFHPNSSISAMRPPCYSLLEEIVILGVMYGNLVWRVCNPAGPVGPQGISGLSPDSPDSPRLLDLRHLLWQCLF